MGVLVSVSIGDVARLAGVSRTTVSHVISGKRPVSDAVEGRVRSAMAELGYAPSRMAQNLASGTTRTMGLLVPDIGNGFFADIAKGVERTAIAGGYNMLLCNTGWNLERELFYLETLKSRAVDGVVYAAGVPAATSQLTGLLGGLPVVAVDEELDDMAQVTVVSDNRVGGRLAAEHLAALGHTRALVAGATEGLASSRLRVEGFSEAWFERTGRAPLVAEGTFEVASGYRLAQEHLGALRDGEVTAVFCLNDMVAFGLMQALSENGIDVPGSCSVVGFDDVFAARHVGPGLTTVRQDAVGLGEVAAGLLLEILENGEALPRGVRVLPVDLVERRSTGGARSRGARHG